MRMAVCLALSGIVHFLVLFRGGGFAPPRPPSPGPARRPAELRVSGGSEPEPEPVEVTAAPAVSEAGETAEPVRFRPEEPAAETRETRDPVIAREVERPPSPPEPPRPRPEPAPEERPPRRQAAARETVRTGYRDESEYRRYRDSLPLGRVEGLPVPDLVISYADEGEILAVSEHFGLRIVVYGRTGPSGETVLIEVADPRLPAFRRLGSLDRERYSNRVRERSGNPFFDRLRARAVEQFGLDESTAHLVSLIPGRVDLYFRFKQIEAARRNGIDPFAVRTTYARYHLTDVGAWILAVEGMRLKDGRTVEVRDFELDDLKG